MTVSLPRLLLATLACLVGACSAPGEAFQTDDPAFLFPQTNRGLLIMSRASSVADDGCSYHVAIDLHEAGSLVPKGWITMYPPPGKHTLSARPEGISCPPAVQIDTWLEVNGQRRFQLVRRTNGNLEWDVQDLLSP